LNKYPAVIGFELILASLLRLREHGVCASVVELKWKYCPVTVKQIIISPNTGFDFLRMHLDHMGFVYV